MSDEKLDWKYSVLAVGIMIALFVGIILIFSYLGNSGNLSAGGGVNVMSGGNGLPESCGYISSFGNGTAILHSNGQAYSITTESNGNLLISCK